MTCLIAVRYRHGVVGETQRSAHLVQVPDNVLDNAPGDVLDNAPGDGILTALCGRQLPRELTEQLEMFRGMPCFACLTRATPSLTGKPPPKKLEFPASWMIK